MLATYLSQFKDLKLSKGLIQFFVITSIWCFCAALVFEVSGLDAKIFFNRIKVASAICVSPAILQVALDFNDSFKFTRSLKLTSLVTSLFFALVMFSPWHEELITSYEIVTLNNIEILHFKNGELFFLHNILSRIYVLVALVLLYQSSTATNDFYKKTAWVFIASILFPFVVDTVGVFFYDDIRYFQLVPVALAFTSLLMTYTLLKHRSISLMPIARSAVFSSLVDPCLVWNAEGSLVDCNEAATHLFKIPTNLKDAGKFEELKVDNSTYFYGKSIYKVRYGYMRNHNKPIGSYAILQDVTDSYNNNIIKTNLMSVLGHDILGHVGQLGFLTETLYFDHARIKKEKLQELTECIYLTTQDLNYFFGDVVHWTRDQFNGWRIKNETFELRSLILSICQYVNSLAKNKQIVINNLVDPQHLVKSDSAMLEIVVRNLIYNAIKHSPQGSEVTIKSDDSLLVISNRGELTNIDQLNNYFSENMTTSIGVGSEGLGHRICKEFLSHLGHELRYFKNGDRVEVVVRLK